MGNRILKESICMSAEIDALSWFEEVVFYRLIVTVDDKGIYPADPVVLAHILFPRKDHISRKMISDALDTLERNHLIQRYSVTGKGEFLFLVSWNQHQRLRNSRPKYPSPDEDGVIIRTASEEVPAGNVPEEESSSREEKDAEEASQTVISLPLNDGSEYSVTQKEADEYAALYPSVNVLQELRSMRGWCLSNDGKKKTRNGIRRFINSWLARVQNRGGTMETRHLNPYQLMACKGEAV